MDLNRWETLTSECSAWRQVVHHDLFYFEETLAQQAKAKRQSQTQQNLGAGQGTDCTVFVFSVEGIVTLKLAFSGTLDAV